uniref:Uncharacterized protein n=1 Tax=viral metagenome TaxID=1070528 RepID=A0A6C0B318_9ZZZZ
MHYISFCSEGEPNDKGLNLSGSKQQLIDGLKKTNLKYFMYSPKYLKDNGYGEFVKEHPNAGLVSMNANMNLVGFCAWKPVIMLLELEKMNDGDILVYRDCNCEKYGQLKDFNDFENAINHIMNKANFDFFIPRENMHLTLKQHCKPNIINELAIDKEFTKDFPLLIANVIICRKSKTSIEILEEWKKYCLVDEFINGEQYGDLNPEFRWFTPEQAILGVLISNYVLEGKHGIPKNYPNIILDNRNIHSVVIVDEIKKPTESFTNLLSTDSTYVVTSISVFAILAVVFYNYKSIYKRIKKLI